jgi:hypothetical protein
METAVRTKCFSMNDKILFVYCSLNATVEKIDDYEVCFRFLLASMAELKLSYAWRREMDAETCKYHLMLATGNYEPPEGLFLLATNISSEWNKFLRGLYLPEDTRKTIGFITQSGLEHKDVRKIFF